VLFCEDVLNFRPLTTIMDNPDCPRSPNPPIPVTGLPASLAGPTGVPVTIGAQRGTLNFGTTAEVKEDWKSLEQLDQRTIWTVTATILDCLLRHHLSGGQKILSDQRQLNLEDNRKQQDFCLPFVKKHALSAARLLPVVLGSMKFNIPILKMQDRNILQEFHALGVILKTFGFWIMSSGSVCLSKISNLSWLEGMYRTT